MKGWQGDSARHGLARRGIKTKSEWKNAYPHLVKRFPGENPRLTEDYARFRQRDPERFNEFKTKKVSEDTKVVLGRNKNTGEFELQSVLIRR